jgi:glucosyl-3-phosphoglycerate phosphatase
VTLAPSTARRVVLWRHGQTVWNAENRFQGQTDVPLDEVGVQQAGRAARLLAALSPDVIVSSDLRRAYDTATMLADILGRPVLVDAGLRETYAGEWEGLVAQDILAKDGDAYRAWQRGEDVRAGTTGERRSEVAERAMAAIHRALDHLPDTSGTVVAVTHGGSARAVVGQLLGLPQEHWGALGGLANCSWSVLAETDGGTRWRLLEHNAGSLPEPVLGDDR